MYVRNLDGVSIDVYRPAPISLAIDRMKRPTISTFDGRTLPFQKNDFDIVLVCYVLHHLNEHRSKELLCAATKVATKRVILLEDSRPVFGPAYRLRNWAHATESNLLYEKQSDDFERNFKHSFKNHGEWISVLESVPRVTNVQCIPLDTISKYRHHTMFVLELS